MYGLIKYSDHDIVAINQSDSTIIIKKNNGFHTIDLKVCSDNFKKEHGTLNGNCVGDRNIHGFYFCFQTSGINTMIYFKRIYIFNLFGNKILHGSRLRRFLKLQKILRQLGYTTYDLS